MNRLFQIFILFQLTACSCSDSGKKKIQETTDLLSFRASFSIAPISEPVAIGELITFKISLTDTSKKFDSIRFFVNGERLGQEKFNPQQRNLEFQWDSKGSNTGTHVFQLEALASANEPEMASTSFFLKSDLEPEILTYQLVNTFPHSPLSFTQGLEWQENRLYEGTGLNGKSALMEIYPQTGKDLIRKDLDHEFFGEGITIMGDKLYQITWQNKKGFVYQLPGLEKVKEFSYPNDGWGLTHWNDGLLMSEGSNKLYWLDAQSFQRKKTIEVWDNKRPVTALNELEEVDGIVYANIYQSDTIVKIDPKTGKVLAYIDLTGILPESDRNGDEDVLNGIAWRKEEKLFYVTGKNWPKLYAVRFVKKRPI